MFHQKTDDATQAKTCRCAECGESVGEKTDMCPKCGHKMSEGCQPWQPKDKKAKEEQKVDEAGRESFPASDPPAWPSGEKGKP